MRIDSAGITRAGIDAVLSHQFGGGISAGRMEGALSLTQLPAPSEGMLVSEPYSCGTLVLLASHQGDTGSIPGRVTPDFRMWESFRTMQLVGGFSQGSPVYPALSFRRRSILTSITLIGSQDLDCTMAAPRLFPRTPSSSHMLMAVNITNMSTMTTPGAMFHGLLCSGTPTTMFADWTGPPTAPDLNPIENLWDELNRRVRARHGRSKSIAQLMVDWLQEEWRRIPADVLQTLVESMPDRVAAVIAARAPGAKATWSVNKGGEEEVCAKEIGCGNLKDMRSVREPDRHTHSHDNLVLQRPLASHQCERGSIFFRVTPGFSQLGIVLDDLSTEPILNQLYFTDTLRSFQNYTSDSSLERSTVAGKLGDQLVMVRAPPKNVTFRFVVSDNLVKRTEV
ncbi:hypothetical protein PR048_001250 [Dryococelus australis]|uniref:Uncharacterized protein n=1 Tax=Dryococelus australis TaxID=614101 RepID=A0ABQ9IGV3_9NEOP|nr:hypothetical protein PR048_001250 [Dryococelus australis]